MSSTRETGAWYSASIDWDEVAKKRIEKEDHDEMELGDNENFCLPAL
jgi:hypothetical protein